MNALAKRELNREFEDLWETIREVKEASDRLDKAADKVIERQKNGNGEETQDGK